MTLPRQDWSPETYLRHASFVPELGGGVLELLDPQPGERVLDLGCGEGLLSARIQEVRARVLGVDAAAAQVEGARARGIEAEVMDGRDLGFAAEFDAVFSNAALHWMAPLERVFDGVCRALKPGGRFVAEMGGQGNVATIRQALYGALSARGFDPARYDPWTFPGVEEARAMLEGAGFRVEDVALTPRPTELPGDIAAWLETFASPFLQAVGAADRDALVDEVRTALTPRLRNDDGVWGADYVRLRFKAVKP